MLLVVFFPCAGIYAFTLIFISSARDVYVFYILSCVHIYNYIYIYTDIDIYASYVLCTKASTQLQCEYEFISIFLFISLLFATLSISIYSYICMYVCEL